MAGGLEAGYNRTLDPDAPVGGFPDPAQRLTMERVISALGLLVLMGAAWLLSSHRRRVSLRPVAGGLALQFVLAVAILKTTPGRRLFEWVGEVFRELLGFVDEGSVFVFGDSFPSSNIAFRVLPTIIFFAALTSVLYHFGVLPRLVRLVGLVMQRTLRTSGAESLCSAANIFVGLTEAPLVVRPYLASMTRSELMSVMVGGFATIAGGVLAAYVGMGIDPTHLVTASVISAPAALLTAKILEPETGVPRTMGDATLDVRSDSVNVVHAITTGTTDGVKLAINVGAMLIVFLAFIALLNSVLGAVGSWVGQEWSLEGLLGILFWPLAWVLGVESGDCGRVGELLGVKIAANEFIAYDRMAKWAEEGVSPISERSRTIATYALCGFANLGSIGIQLGGLGPLVPERRAELARLAVRAMLGGAIAGFMTACVAGILI